MSPVDIATVLLTGGGLFFYLAGSVGLLRFPDVYSRLHALTKADNLGLGLLLLGLAPQMANAFQIVLLLLIWLLVMAAGAACCHLVARHAYNAQRRVENGREERAD
ncbi:monovalent cation/H(+) antiporter subunit G [Exilibacterium tricleocarpae]|uniref:Monovalent cation/H(+) antiporter subunit G n=1 Tax=Exilibacterium tricleocarpae TaxID=2591008 RepID=A0A545U6M2_9GAMM|nr:monovalent cation/H(+) antiporter subunit G [Exilibacterium tricleocarpae]TQV85121.1 monovalent cation/H(+) antiporter subunit G [Exilibacterium tricleocarpae]